MIQSVVLAMNTSLTLPSRRSYAILGTGAVGGFYGARLQRVGLEVHFLLNRDYEQVCQTGLKIDSPEGDFTLPQIQAYHSVQQMPACDVVIVALKTTYNHLLPQLLPPVLKESGVVLVLQNGLGVEQEVAKIVGDDRVMGGLCFICSNKVGAGHIQHLDYSQINLGDYQKDYQLRGITDRMKQISADFERAGIPIQLAHDLYLARWQKLVWNIPFNGLSVVLNARTDEIMANAFSRELVTALMAEVVEGAKSCDRQIASSFVEKMIDHTVKMKPYKTSMKLDYDHQKPLEIETILGNPLRVAIANGVALPKISMLYQQIKFLDAQNSPQN